MQEQIKIIYPRILIISTVIISKTTNRRTFLIVRFPKNPDRDRLLKRISIFHRREAPNSREDQKKGNRYTGKIGRVHRRGIMLDKFHLAGTSGRTMMIGKIGVGLQ